MLAFPPGMSKSVRTWYEAHMQVAMKMSSVPLPNALGLNLADVATCWGWGLGAGGKPVFLKNLQASQALWGCYLIIVLHLHYEGGIALPLNDGEMRGEGQQEPLSSGFKPINPRSSSAQLQNPRFSYIFFFLNIFVCRPVWLSG